MTTATQMLTLEHKNIIKVIDALKRECDAIEKGKSIDKEFFSKSIDFIKGYADHFHHAKEEDILFIELNKDDVKMHCNPTGQMLHEHDIGREFVMNLEKAVKENNSKKVVENAVGYANLLEEHIMKEDKILYPMADEALSEKTQKEMLGKFNKIEKDSSKEKDKYLAFIKEAEKRK